MGSTHLLLHFHSEVKKSMCNISKAQLYYCTKREYEIDLANRTSTECSILNASIVHRKISITMCVTQE